MSKQDHNDADPRRTVQVAVLHCDQKEAITQALMNACSKEGVSIEVVERDVVLLTDSIPTIDPQIFEKRCVEPALEASGFYRHERDYESVFKKKGGVRRR